MQSMNDGFSTIQIKKAILIALLVVKELGDGIDAVCAKIYELARGDQKVANLAMLILADAIKR